MEFKVLKLGGLVKQSQILFTIGEDEFYYKKKKNDEKFHKYHISYLNEIYIQKQIKERPELILILEINVKNMEKKDKDKKSRILKLATKDDKNTEILSDIKRILNVKRLKYDIYLFLYNWKQKINIVINKDKLTELKDVKKSYKIKHSIMEEIEKKYNKEKINELLQDKLNNFVKLLNQKNLEVDLLDEGIIKKIREIINGNFILDNEEHNNKKNDLKKMEEIKNYNNIYGNLIKLYTLIKYCLILKRFKEYDRKYLLETQKYNPNKGKNINNDNKEQNLNNNSNLILPNDSAEEIKIVHSETYIHKDNLNEIQVKDDDLEVKIKKKNDEDLIILKQYGLKISFSFSK